MAVTYPLADYYNRFDPSKNYEKHLVRAGKGTQSAEINEIQEAGIARLKGISDALFKDGDVIRDCQAIVDAITGEVTLEGGALYIRGSVRGVAPKTFTVPVNTVVQIGIRLLEEIVTELDDPALRDPAVGTRNFDEPGAGRLRVTASWGWDGDGEDGDFYAVYTVDNGNLLSKEPPPAFDGVTTAIARYDRDSAGGNYIITGLQVSSQYDRVNGKIIVLVGEGRARAGGYPVEVGRSVRLVYDADPDLKAVVAEPKTFTPAGDGKMRVNLNNTPLIQLQQVRYTRQKLQTMTHGPFAGAADPLPDNSVLSIVAVNQGGTWNGTSFTGGTTYTAGTDYNLVDDDVDWSPGGAEPAPGSSYQVAYQYLTTAGATITEQDDYGFKIQGPVAGSIFTIDYTFAMPRIDAMVLDSDGRLSRIKGISSQYTAGAPGIPDTQLKIATLVHNWFGDATVKRDGTVVMPMDELQGMKALVFDLFDLIAQERLRTDAALADPTAKRGVFVDPFNNDNLRDGGISQNLAIVDGELILPIDPTVFNVGTAVVSAELLPYSLEVVVEQPYRTGVSKINPYQAFDPLPATVVLSPAFDFWTVVNEVWLSEITRRFVSGSGNRSVTTTTTQVQVAVREEPAQFIRQRTVNFTLSGFGPGEVLQTLTFDGIAVTPENP